MASFGRAIASGVTNIAEIAPALVNLNFNFALHQVEAPHEFQGVGNTISRLRRVEAETGRSHVTARILGALFASLIPKTPKLLSIYGLRASEIAASLKINPSQSKEYGFFSSRAGADATTVWAGATSGPGAIAVHLLACLLAQMWDPSEATSIWMEIVKYRSDNILNSLGEGCMVDFSDVAAAKNTLSRQQLAEWDASARAWLEAAKRVKYKEQRKLMLIIDNLHQQVNSVQGTFESVIKAWQNSLTVFEALLNGISQKANTGDIFLALSAWHLYPDLMILEPCPKTLRQADPLLLSCGVLTVGLHRKEQEQGGICWSLPLAQLRHYGLPVNRERTLKSTQRLTLAEFTQVFLGAFLYGWGDRGTETTDMVLWLDKLRKILMSANEHKNPSLSNSLSLYETGSWLGILFDASARCLQAFEVGDESHKQLLRLGRRYGRTFLGNPLQGPFFGLSKKGGFVSCARTEDDKIKILREAAAELPGLPSQMFIRVRHKLLDGVADVYEYATAKPMERPSSKRHNDGSYQPVLIHQRWLYSGGKIQHHGRDTTYFRKLVGVFPELATQIVSVNPSAVEYDEEIEGPKRGNIISICSSFVNKNDPHIPHRMLSAIQTLFDERFKKYTEQGEDVLYRERCTVNDFRVEKMGVYWPDYASNERSAHPWYEMVYGDESAALYADLSTEGIRQAAEGYSSTQFRKFFESPHLDSRTINDALQGKLGLLDLTRDYHRSLKAVSTAARLYKSLNIATIDVRVLEQSLWKSPWIRGGIKAEEIRLRSIEQEAKSTAAGDESSNTLEILNPYPLDLASAFSCICFFESGRFQIEPGNLQKVMAMCSNDLIWVSSCLLNDPSSQNPRNEEAHVRVFPGNIGRIGIAFLVPPVDPMRRTNSIHDFRDIVHRPFEGHLQNNFRTTSLHLSFTTAVSPLGVDFSGMKDDELYLLETLLSVHEGGGWVADLDVLSSFSSGKYMSLILCHEHRESGTTLKPEASCIDNWAELLEPPEEGLGVVRASGDWQARLATFAIAVLVADEVVVLPHDHQSICWVCINREVSSEIPEKQIVLIA